MGSEGQSSLRIPTYSLFLFLFYLSPSVMTHTQGRREGERERNRRGEGGAEEKKGKDFHKVKSPLQINC